MTLITLALFVGLISLWIMLDCDVKLYFASYDENKAFNNQVIWIVGASSGIGAALAIDLAKGGAQVILSARRVDRLYEVAANCTQYHSLQPDVIPLDITNYEQQKDVYQQIITKYGRLDSVILNAGRTQRSLSVETPLTTTKDIFELNVFSYVALSNLIVPTMIKANSGQVVILSSIAGKIGLPIQSSYCATKHALQGYYDGLRAEVHQHNINILTVLPGPVESEIAEVAFKLENKELASEGENMATSRCTYLIAKAMTHRMDEVWISPQPFLLILYLNQYFPWAMRQLSKYIFGPGRVRVYQEGGSPYDLKLSKDIFGPGRVRVYHEGGSPYDLKEIFKRTIK